MATFNKKKKFLLVTAAVVLIGGAAAAYWTSGGSGSGSAQTQNPGSTVTLVGTTLTQLAPDVSSVIEFTASNSSEADATIGTISATFTSTTVGCQTLMTAHPTYFHMDDVVSGEIVAGDAVDQDLVATGVVEFDNDAAVNQNACKNAAIVIALSVTAGA